MSIKRWGVLDIEGFRGIAQARVELPSSGVWHVRGRNLDAPGAQSNGAGKSSFLGAMLWVLTGEADREKSKADGIMPASGGDCRVSLTFETVDGHSYTIKRTRFRKGRKADGKTIKATLSLSRDGEAIESSDINTTQETINAVLGLDADSFRATAYFTNACRFAGMTDKEAKQLLERLLDVGKLEQALEATRIDLAVARRSVTDATIAVHKAASVVEQVERNRTAATEQAQLDSEARAKLVADREAAVRVAEAALHEAQQVAAGVDVDAVRGQLAEVRTVVDEGARALGAAQAEYRAAQQRVRACSVDDVASLVGGPCPTCRRPVTDADLEALTEHVRAELEAAEAEEQSKAGAVDELQQALDGARCVVRQLEQQERDQQRKRDEVKSAESRVQHARQSLDAVKAEPPPASAAWAAAAEQDATKAASDKAAAEQNLEAAQREQATLEYVEAMFGLRGLRAMVLDEIEAPLNERLAAIMEQLTGGSVSVALHATGRRSNGEPDGRVRVEASVNGGGKEYAECSRGERARVDVPCMLALRDLAMTRRGVDPGILVLDEVLDEMDAAGASNIMPLLDEVAKACPVLLVSHRPEIAGADNRITITKRGGVSVVELGDGSSDVELPGGDAQPVTVVTGGA